MNKQGGDWVSSGEGRMDLRHYFLAVGVTIDDNVTILAPTHYGIFSPLEPYC